MRYVVTLTNVRREDGEDLGFRASDLAVLKDKGFNVPLTFVVNNEALEDFMAENGLKAKVERVFLEKPDQDEAYREILNLFVKSKFPRELQSELEEAYDSLAIEPGSGANSIITGADFPIVTLIRSPSYLLPEEDEEGILQNLKGHEALFLGLKLIWSSMLSPSSREYRSESGISEGFSMSVMVQKMKRTKVSAEAYSRTEFNEYMLRVKSFRGYRDIEDPVHGKDVHEIDVNSLLIRNHTINHQEYELVRAIDSDELTKCPLLDDGQKQKLNDRLICECARVAKRSKSIIGKDLKLYLSVFNDYINILQVNRLVMRPRESAREVEVAADAEAAAAEAVEEPEALPESAGELKMPEILSSEQAKEHAMKDMGHKIFSLRGFLEGFVRKKEQPPAAPKAPEYVEEPAKITEEITEEIVAVIEEPDAQQDSAGEVSDYTQPAHPADDNEIIRELAGSAAEPEQEPEAPQETEHDEPSPEQVEREQSLLHDVFAIKEFIGRMEAHAINNNKERYEQEARQLKKLLQKIRDEE